MNDSITYRAPPVMKHHEIKGAFSYTFLSKEGEGL